MAIRKSAALMIVVGTVAVVGAGLGSDAHADPPAAFGPVASRSFAWKPGTAIEQAVDPCSNNADWLLIRGPGLTNAKSLDITPHTASPWERQSPFSGTCVAPDCVQIYVKVTSKDAVGPYTVTLTHADGRKTTTTFDVTKNAGRCDYPKGSK
jgi:hypothetical protein